MSGDLALYSRIMFIFDGLHKAWGQKTLTRHGVERILFPHWTKCDKKLVVVVNYCTYTKPINGWFKLSWQLVCLWYEHTNKIESTLWLRTDFIILAAYRRLASIFVVIWIQQTQSVNLNLDQFYVWVLFLHIDRKKMKLMNEIFIQIQCTESFSENFSIRFFDHIHIPLSIINSCNSADVHFIFSCDHKICRTPI